MRSNSIFAAYGLPLLGLAAVYFVAKWIWGVIYNVYFHPLSKFPGEPLAGATRLYESYQDLAKGHGGNYVYEVERMHQKYGPIVRINPDELHIDDLDYYDTLYALNRKVDKDPHHIQIFGTPLSLFGSETHDEHKARRIAVNPFFSKASVDKLEPQVLKCVRKLGDRISQCGKENKLVPLREALVCVTVDIVTEYCFANCANTLDSPNFAPEWEAMMTGVTEAVPMAKAMPGIVQFMQAMPLSVIRFINPLMGAFFDYNTIIRKQVQAARAENAALLDTEKQDAKASLSSKNKQTTVFHELLASSLPPAEKSEERLTQEGVGLISAASETTSLVLASTLFHILDNKHLIPRLREELKPLMPTPLAEVSSRDLEKVPLLNAIVKEGLRISTAICGRLPLKTAEPLQYKEWTIPPHTSVSMSARDALMNSTVYPSPLKFNPDRWLDASPEQRALMDKAFLPFNKGPRMCVGFNLAYADIYHNLSSILMRFDLELVDVVRERDIDMVRDHFVAKPTRKSKGLAVRVLKEYE